MFEKTGIRKDIWKYGFELYEEDLEFKKQYENQRKRNEDSTANLGDFNDIIPEEEIIPIERKGDTENEENLIDPKIDSTRYSSAYSGIIVEMHKAQIKDSLINEYVSAKFAAGNLSPSVFFPGFLERKDKYNYDNFYAKIIVIIEVYYGLIRQNIEINESSKAPNNS
jgi:hypothetical protein